MQSTWVRLRLIGVALALVVAAGGVAVAAPCVPGQPCPSPTPTPTPAPTPTPPPEQPTPSPTATPEVPRPTPPVAKPSPTPSATAKGSPTPGPSDGAAEESSDLPPGLEQPTFNIPFLARTAPRNTFELIEALQPLTRFGFSLQQVLILGMGRFPVAGVAFWSDDWHAPRPGPPPHLHEGLDIFADFGTPIRAPDDGVISSMGDESSDRLGGTNVYLRGSDGTEYYFAHVLAHAEGLHVGKSVKVGEVIAFVGDTGNARGGAPHLHLEIHKSGPIPPKPIVDKWLDDAEAFAPSWVKLEAEALQSRKGAIQGPSRPTPGKAAADLDTSMLLTLLDPIGGSVGLLPRLDLRAPTTPVSSLLWTQLIRLRLDGHVLVPGKQSLIQGD